MRVPDGLAWQWQRWGPTRGVPSTTAVIYCSSVGRRRFSQVPEAFRVAGAAIVRAQVVSGCWRATLCTRSSFCVAGAPLGLRIRSYSVTARTCRNLPGRLEVPGAFRVASAALRARAGLPRGKRSARAKDVLWCRRSTWGRGGVLLVIRLVRVGCAREVVRLFAAFLRVLGAFRVVWQAPCLVHSFVLSCAVSTCGSPARLSVVGRHET